jgi:hypothetical protein
MIINSNKSCSAIIVIVFALLAGTLSSAALSPQQPQRVPTPEEQRKRMLERLSRGTQQTQPGTKSPPIKFRRLRLQLRFRLSRPQRLPRPPPQAPASLLLPDPFSGIAERFS